MIQKFIQTGIMSNDWSDLTGVDKVTYDTAKKIEVMSNGLTVKQFQEALSIALDFVNRYSILSTQSFQKKETQD